MRLALLPLNPTVGDLPGNKALALAGLEQARNADLAVLPELFVSGYPPRDLLWQEGFVPACAETAREIGARAPRGLTVVVGAPLPAPSARGVTNSLLVFRDGVELSRYDKRLLPTYDVFDEDRYFTPGSAPVTFTLPRANSTPLRIGLAICEDLWKGEDAGFSSRYHASPDPVAELTAQGIDLLLSPSASPFVLGKHGRHRAICAAHARRSRCAVASVNQLGGNDELVFDGHAMLFDPAGNLAAASTLFTPEPLLTTLDAPSGNPAPPPDASPDTFLLDALVLGVRDYFRKTGHSKAILGLSGGIDSALACTIAALAIGPQNVTGVAMPGPYSTDHALADARALAQRLGVRLLEVPVLAAVDAFRPDLDRAFASIGAPPLGATLPDLAEENLQSRVRGVTLMALSNRTGAIVLTTGNKSELAVGYCTLYGDMNGGLCVLSDLTKQAVYRLSRSINARHASLGFAAPPIPRSTLDKPPSAELRPDQKDQDSLPPYDVLDDILERYIEGRQSLATIARDGPHDPALVKRIVELVDRNEFKRRQMAVGLKVTSVAFGVGRRFPIAQRYRA